MECESLVATQMMKIPEPRNSKTELAYSSSENLFDPSRSKSPPVSDFMKRLSARNKVYNKFENLPRFTSA